MVEPLAEFQETRRRTELDERSFAITTRSCAKHMFVLRTRGLMTTEDAV